MVVETYDIYLYKARDSDVHNGTPAATCSRNDVQQRRDVITSQRCRYDVAATLCVCWDAYLRKAVKIYENDDYPEKGLIYNNNILLPSKQAMGFRFQVLTTLVTALPLYINAHINYNIFRLLSDQSFYALWKSYLCKLPTIVLQFSNDCG